jgi:hypothetical protein
VSEILLGAIAPLVAAVGSWVLMERTYNQNPAQLTPLMVKAFAAKVVFFGLYVVIMLRALSIRPLPFIVSFTSVFVALHLIEAFCLRRLLAGRR